MQATQTNLVRKQVMLSVDNIHKFESMAVARGSSVSEVIRVAVDAYNPDTADIGETELIGLVSTRLEETIADTARTRKRLNKTLNQLAAKG